MLKDLLAESGADVLVLNETMRPSKKPWPTYLPACAAEATKEQPSASDANPRRNPNGVAVLVSDRARKAKGAVQVLEVLELYNVLGQYCNSKYFQNLIYNKGPFSTSQVYRFPLITC